MDNILNAITTTSITWQIKVIFLQQFVDVISKIGKMNVFTFVFSIGAFIFLYIGWFSQNFYYSLVQILLIFLEISMRSIEKIIGCLHENLIKFRLKTFPAFLNNSLLSKAFNIIRIYTTVKYFLLLMFISVFVRLLVCMLVNQTNKKQ